MSTTVDIDIRERKPQRLIILEGPDCSGKSTLAKALADRLLYHTLMHHGPYPRLTSQQLPRFYAEGMATSLQRWHGLVMDRSWLSEQVYGPIYRGADRLATFQRRHLERIALRLGAVVVLCLPPWADVRDQWARRKGLDPKAEMLDNEDQLRRIYDAYHALETDLPVVHYDYTIHGRDVSKVLGQVDRRSTGLHPWLAPSVGSTDSKVILVGEKPSDHTDADTLMQWPFSSFSRQGSSAWLTEMLHANGILETDLLWLNAGTGFVTPLERLYARPVIALGNEASKELARHHISHETVAHPQHHKRFKGGEPYPLIDLIKKHL